MNSESSINSFDLILCTCDKYQYLWDGFLYFLGKNWPSFQGNILFTSSFVTSNRPGVNCVGKTRNTSWSSRLIKALHISKSKVVLVMLDDFFITKKVDEEYVRDAFILISKNKKIKCVTLRDAESHKDYGEEDYDKYFVRKKNQACYCVTTQASFWNKKYLLKLLHHGENAWQFEREGSNRHRIYNKLFLYRKDEYNQSFYYPRGGVLWGGKIHGTQETYDAIHEANVDISKEKQSSLAVLQEYAEQKTFFKTMYRKFFRHFAAFFPWLPYF